ncbi:AAA domain-containing protein [Aspergillus carlsbadensis]|nr:AAA domain-containing protein [Aspergillus carlsbadensis]
MPGSSTTYDTPAVLSPLLRRTRADPRPVVVMTCGIAGSGKSSLSKWITSAHPSFKRLSIDSYIYTHYGLYNIDFPKEKYNEYQEEAEAALRAELPALIQAGTHDAILDFSFAFQATRDEWKELIEEAGGRWVLAYLEVEDDELRRRVRERNALAVKDGDSAFVVTEQVLESFLMGFERPVGEEEVILRLGEEFKPGAG